MEESSLLSSPLKQLGNGINSDKHHEENNQKIEENKLEEIVEKEAPKKEETKFLFGTSENINFQVASFQITGPLKFGDIEVLPSKQAPVEDDVPPELANTDDSVINSIFQGPPKIQTKNDIPISEKFSFAVKNSPSADSNINNNEKSSTTNTRPFTLLADHKSANIERTNKFFNFANTESSEKKTETNSPFSFNTTKQTDEKKEETPITLFTLYSSTPAPVEKLTSNTPFSFGIPAPSQVETPAPPPGLFATSSNNNPFIGNNNHFRGNNLLNANLRSEEENLNPLFKTMSIEEIQWDYLSRIQNIFGTAVECSLQPTNPFGKPDSTPTNPFGAPNPFAPSQTNPFAPSDSLASNPSNPFSFSSSSNTSAAPLAQQTFGGASAISSLSSTPVNTPTASNPPSLFSITPAQTSNLFSFAPTTAPSPQPALTSSPFSFSFATSPAPQNQNLSSAPHPSPTPGPGYVLCTNQQQQEMYKIGYQFRSNQHNTWFSNVKAISETGHLISIANNFQIPTLEVFATVLDALAANILPDSVAEVVRQLSDLRDKITEIEKSVSELDKSIEESVRRIVKEELDQLQKSPEISTEQPKRVISPDEEERIVKIALSRMTSERKDLLVNIVELIQKKTLKTDSVENNNKEIPEPVPVRNPFAISPFSFSTTPSLENTNKEVQELVPVQNSFAAVPFSFSNSPFSFSPSELIRSEPIIPPAFKKIRYRKINLKPDNAINNVELENLVKANPSVTYLNLSECDKIEAKGLKAIAENCRHLAKLDLSFCIRTVDSDLIALSKGCPELVELVLWWCRGITSVGVESVLENCSKLMTLDLRNTDVESIKELKAKYPDKEINW